MRKIHFRLFAALSVLVSLALPAVAQVNNPNSHRTVRTKQEPCWQQVGVSKDVIDQRDAIQKDTHSQVEAVCADSLLNVQQKKQKIHEIRQEAKQKISGLISEEQQQQLEACHKERAGNSPVAVVKHPGAGPCGELESPNGVHSGQTSGSGAESH